MMTRLFSIAALLLASAPALAQGNQLYSAPPLYTSVAASDLTSLIASRGYAARVAQEVNGVTVIEVTAPEGGAFYIALTGCENGRCALMETITYFSAAGLTLNQANEIHRDRMAVSTIILLPNNGVVLRKTFFEGGATMDFIAAQIGLYLHDVEQVTAALTGGVIAKVEFGSKSDFEGRGVEAAAFAKIDNYRVNPVGANAPGFNAGVWSGGVN